MRSFPAKPAVAVLAAASLLTACKPDAPYEDVRPVRTEIVKAGEVAMGASYSGEVRARRETRMGFRVNGKIAARLVEVGQSVKAGQPLLRLDPQDASLSQAASEAQVTAAKAEMTQAKMDLDRTRQLFARNFVSQAEVDRRELAFNTADAKYKQAVAQGRVVSNQAGYTTLLADRAGIVTAIDAEVGQVVAAGQTVVKLAEDGEREVAVSVPESRVEELRRASKLTVSLWIDPSKRYEGKLREIAPDTDPVTRTYAAKVTIQNADEAIRLGMTASVQLDSATAKGAVRLPLTAIYDREGKPLVWVVDPRSSTVNLREVKIVGVRDNQMTVIGGLQEGEQVVTAGVHMLHPGQKVRLAESQRSESQPAPATTQASGGKS
ncbi:efflux RND transporter periplasmic adaptor subunit [Parachitinimonas caeni]|uniref:Efflux RND transporter periplasmic adaptor subunit n=1 Tax=Parachitinimonas caeni TaxID=3031301 RepID=A0ABT7E5V6_9NEIS|nr:efflux RND transporter periplasmic adaptor subunit [Parachitinimonas caeni]MDK2126297.1 efflux RND transporter periplasmic adaptor subunit [Parachitinimonas caeni]